jgi:hypothetical protein
MEACARLGCRTRKEPMTRIAPLSLFFLAAVISATVVLALYPARCAFAGDAPATAPPPCLAREHRQFDFWLGDWDVRDAAGKVVGHNRIAALHKGCALEENWSGAGGFSGTSLNAYDADRGQWHQTWVDSSGGLLQLDGGIVDGKMVLSGVTVAADAAGRLALQRITWTPLPDGRVRQLWESSADAGKTWTVAFDGFYAKAN